MDDVCVWSLSKYRQYDESEYYAPCLYSEGNYTTFYEEQVEKFHYCPYCSKPIKIKEEG